MKRYIDKSFITGLLRASPEASSAVSKLVEPADDEENSEKGYAHNELTTEYFSAPKDFASNYQSSLDALKLFPDLELAASIYASLVVSSGDLATNKIVVSSNETLLLPDVKAKLLRIIETELKTGYTLVDKLDEIVIELLIGKGSVARVTIPENSLDDFINGRIPFNRKVALETENATIGNGIDGTVNLGILGEISEKPVGSIALEGDENFFTSDELKFRRDKNHTITNLEIIDNFHCLKYGKLREAETSSSLESVLYGAPLSSTGANPQQQTGVVVNKDEILPEDMDGPKIRRKDIFSRVKVEESSVSEVHADDYSTRDSITRPLTFEIPAESVIPVITPGRPDSAKGYFIMLDDKYNFLTLETRKCDKEKGIHSQLESGSMDSDTKSKIASYLGGKRKTDELNSGEIAFRRFKEVIERDMADRLNTGIHAGTSFEITQNQDIEYLMFLRSLAGKKTKLLFLPSEMVAYYALKYDDQGIGKNVLADLKELNNMRGTLLFSEVLATIKNNLRTTNVHLDIDPGDPDPSKTIKIATAEVMKTRAMDLPTNMSSISQLGDWIQRAGYTFSFSNHPGLPQVKFDFTDETIERRTGNSDEILDTIRDQQFNAFGLTPEIVDTGLDVNFATTDQANRKFLLKRIRKTRGILSRVLSKEVLHIVRCDPYITKQLEHTLEGVKVKDADGTIVTPEMLMIKFLQSMSVTLPNLEEDNNVAAQAELYENFADALDVALEPWLSEEMYDQAVFGDDLPELLDTLRAQIRGHYLRDYQTKTGYFSELGDMTTLDSNGDSYMKMGDIIPEHVIGILNTAKDFYKGLKVENKKMTRLIGEIREYIESEDEDMPDDTSDDQVDDVTDGEDSDTEIPSDDTGADDNTDDTGEEGDDVEGDGEEGDGIAGLPKLSDKEDDLEMVQPDENETKDKDE